jgi:hypothetical protein
MHKQLSAALIRRQDWNHIFVNFDAEPPAIFCTRRVSSSFFRSDSCLDKSFLDLKGLNPMVYLWLSCNVLGLELVGLDFSHFSCPRRVSLENVVLCDQFRFVSWTLFLQLSSCSHASFILSYLSFYPHVNSFQSVQTMHWLTRWSG